MPTLTHHTPQRFVRALGEWPFWMAGLNLLTRFHRPVDSFVRYLAGTGSYPALFTVRTPLGPRRVTAYTYHDLLTLVECFGKVDYRVPADIKTVVDVGANIGISALYFLTRNADVRVELYEPVEANVERIASTLRGFEDRYTVRAEAVGLTAGTASFAVEPTGRYGGLVTERYLTNHGIGESKQVEVPVVGVNEVVERATARWGSVDLLKLDVEWMEDALIGALTTDSLASLGRIYAETDLVYDIPGFRRTRYGSITRFARR